MTTQAVATQQVPDAATDDSRSQRLLALSGIAFVPLFLVGWFAPSRSLRSRGRSSGGVTPHYGADGTTDGSPFGYGFFPGAIALVT